MARYAMNRSAESECEALTTFLDKQRDILVRKIEGVSDDDARSTPEYTDINTRWIVMHIIEEVARHAGHADITRGTIDGSIGE